MKWYGNLKIGTKLAVAFSLIIALVAVLAIYSTITSKGIDSQYSYLMDYPQKRLDMLLEVNRKFISARRALSHMSVFSGLDNAETNIGGQLNIIDSLISEMNSDLIEIKNILSSDPHLNHTERDECIEIVDEVLVLLAQWRTDVVAPVAQAKDYADTLNAETTVDVNKSISDVTKVAGIITNISTTSQEQQLAIGQLTDGIAQIADVIQNNSATSEESASASQQLSSQGEVLKNMVNVFKLKKKYM